MPFEEKIVVRISKTQRKMLESLIDPDKHLWCISDVVREAINHYLKAYLSSETPKPPT